MLNLLLITTLVGTLITALATFLMRAQDFVETRIRKDTWLGDTAESIATSERSISRINAQLETMHASCAAILALPPLASQAALNSGRLLSRQLAGTQRVLRAHNRRLVMTAQGRRYQTKIRLSERRHTNPCNFVGPFAFGSHDLVQIRDANSGVRIDVSPIIEWRFNHPLASRAWF